MNRKAGQTGFVTLWVGILVAISLTMGAVLASRWFGSLYGVRHIEQTFWQRSLAESAVHLALAHVNASDTYAGATTETMAVAVTQPPVAPPLTSAWSDLAAYAPEDWRWISIRLPSGKRWQAMAKAAYEPLFRCLIDARERIELQEVSTFSIDSEVTNPKDPQGGDRNFLGDLIGGQIVLHAVEPHTIGGRVLCDPNSSVVIDPGITVTGERRALSKPWPRAPLPEVQGAILPTPPGKTQAMPKGTYRTSSLYIQTPSRFVFGGPTVIHVEGNATIGPESLMATTNRASDLILVVHGTQCEIFLPFNGGIFAPDAEVILHGTGNFVGAIVARSVRNDGQGQLIFDRAISRRTRGPRQAFRLLDLSPADVPGDPPMSSDIPASPTSQPTR